MLKLTFLILRYRVCIHNGNRKLNLAIVSAANIVLFYSFYFRSPVFVLLYEDILENVNKRVYSRQCLERVGRVTVNISIFSPNLVQ